MSEAQLLALQEQQLEEGRARREQTREAILYGFERIAPATMEQMQTAGAALATLSEKENELSQKAQVGKLSILILFFEKALAQFYGLCYSVMLCISLLAFLYESIVDFNCTTNSM